MTSTLQVEAEAFIQVVRTADGLVRNLDLLLKRHKLTFTQYNALRILRGAGGAGASGRDVADRMINAQPDVTRLLDRLEKRGLIQRCRADQDRRFVKAWITPGGLDMLAGLDKPVTDLHRQQFAALTKEELAQLKVALEKAGP